MTVHVGSSQWGNSFTKSFEKSGFCGFILPWSFVSTSIPQWEGKWHWREHVRDFITSAGKQYFSVSFRKPDWFTLKVLVAQCLTLCDPMDCSLCPWNSPGENTGVGCHSLLQGMSPIQELNSSLPHRRQIFYHLSHQGSPNILQFVSENLIGSPKQSALMASVIIKWSFQHHTWIPELKDNQYRESQV